jgi:hypothetical protein
MCPVFCIDLCWDADCGPQAAAPYRLRIAYQRRVAYL